MGNYWKGMSKEELNLVDSIIKDEMFRYGGETLRSAFIQQNLGSYWLIEFRSELGEILKSQGEEAVRLVARREIETR